MKKHRFTDEQMVAIPQDKDRTSVPQVASKYMISEQCLYVWRRKYYALEPVGDKCLRSLETENAKFRKLPAERHS